jgi:uncharacterized membrane protein YeiB
VDANNFSSRVVALDAARGIAILMMAYVHMVPSDGQGLAQLVTKALEGKAAVLFFILAGMTWARMSTDKLATIYRRAGLYCVIGILMHTTIWNTEVLLPLGLCLALFQLVRGKQRIGDMLAILGLAATLFVPLMFNVDTAIDVFEQPSEFLKPGGLLRAATFVLFTSSYPVVPWWSLVWFGSRITGKQLGKPLSIAVLGAVSALVGVGITAMPGVVPAALRPLTAVTWTPTTLPFILQCGGTALIIIGLVGWQARLFNFLIPLGRMSLTHYIGHIVCVCIPLYAQYTEWTWPASVGLAAYGSWAAGALLLSHLWMKRFQRGPLEMAITRLVSL